MIKNTEEKIKNSLLTRNFKLISINHYNTYKDSKITAECLLCGKEVSTTMKSMMKPSYHKCHPIYNTSKMTTESFSKLVKETDADYEVIGEYKNKRSKIEILHISKHHTFFISPEDFKSGCRCSVCNKKTKKSTIEFQEELNSVFKPNEYVLMEEYDGALKKIAVKHSKCNKTFKTRPNDLLNKHGCPYCKESLTERLIAELLTELNISFVRQKSFAGCKYKNRLRFDFYIEDKNICIEYDGEFHYSDFYTEEHMDFFEAQKKRDEIKTKYCEENGIKLIRIPYTDKHKITKEYLITLLS